MARKGPHGALGAPTNSTSSACSSQARHRRPPRSPCDACSCATVATSNPLYETKEHLAAFYRIRSHAQAGRALTELTDRLALTDVPELRTFRATLLRWRREILAYFRTRATNGMTEGFNGKAKLVERRAYGESFANYRLRLPNACA